MWNTKLEALATVLLSAGALGAQSNPNAQHMMRHDGAFVTAAAQGGMAEVQMGRLAVEKASDPKVKEFGQRMVDDHTKAGNELKSTAERDGVALPPAISAKQKATLNRLSRLSGSAFDRAYMQDMVKDHEEDVAAFQREADKGSDPDMKVFAGKTLPTLQDHLREAKQTESQLKQ